jgi:hypothetical protein
MDIGKTGLFFYLQYDALFHTPQEVEGWELADIFEMGEFDKLRSWWETCRQKGIPFEDYSSDSWIKSHHIPVMLSLLEENYSAIAARRPWVHHDDWEKLDPFPRMRRILQSAINRQCGLIALCD